MGLSTARPLLPLAKLGNLPRVAVVTPHVSLPIYLWRMDKAEVVYIQVLRARFGRGPISDVVAVKHKGAAFLDLAEFHCSPFCILIG